MPNIPAGFGEIVFRYNWPGVDSDLMVCTLGVEIDTDGGVSQLNVEALADGWHDTCGQNLTNDLRWLGCDLHYRTVAGEFSVSAITFADAGPGASGTLGVGTKSAVVVRKHTLRGGRKGRGRMFWAGAINTHVDDNENLNSTGVAAWAVQGANFLDLFPIGGITAPVLLHTTTNAAPDTIIALDAAPLTGTMRRRYRN